MSSIRNLLLAALMSLLVLACQKTHAGGSSGSNWLQCEKVADCAGSEDAEKCSADGYCEDGDGNRILQSEPLVGKKDAGDADATEPNGEAGSGAIAMMVDADVITGESDRCLWSVRDQLRAVGIEAPARVNCGSFNSAIASRDGALDAAYSCFQHSLDSGVAAELTINRCTDCSIPSTYIGIPGIGLYELLLEDDAFGDETRMSRLSQCQEIALDSGDYPSDIICTEPTSLQSCVEPRSLERVPGSDTEAFLPLEPFKIADPLGGEAVPTVQVHLYVSSQRSEGPIDIAIFIDDLQVVAGDFDPGDQHNWYVFNFTVPNGMHTLRASTRSGVVHEQEVDLSGERWAVVDYWAEGDGAPSMFTLNVSDIPIAFD